MASPIKHIPPRRIFIGESVFFPLTSCTTIATNIRTTDIAGIKNNATIPIERKQRNAIPTYTAQSSINNLFVNLFLQIVLALPSSSVDDLFSISCRPRISISLCAFVTLGVEISCSHFAIVCLDTPSSAAKASCVSPFRFLASAICFPDNMHYTSPFYYLLLMLIKSNSSHTFKHFYDYFMLTP